MQIGCCSSPDNLCLLDQLGYDFIDLPGAQLTNMSESEFTELKHKLTINRLPCLGIHASISEDIQIIGYQVNYAAQKEYLTKLMKRAKEIDAKFIGIGSPKSRRMPYGYKREQADKQMELFLNIACDLAGDQVSILLESINRTETNYINTIDEAVQLIDQLQYENTGLIFDIYHFLKEQENPNLITCSLVKKIKYLHIADPNKREFPQKCRISIFKDSVNRLLACGYMGAISIEAITNHIEIDAEGGLAASRELLEIKY
jgi:D-psicose/D-tagatose/L-ribulose 3-epimerase